jgi:hypothetical protein
VQFSRGEGEWRFDEDVGGSLSRENLAARTQPEFIGQLLVTVDSQTITENALLKWCRRTKQVALLR